ncbi:MULTISPECIES: hypothetical protein [unclassified Thermococcus]|nr:MULTISPECIES: hypothetical protein [unclassified Thermococcus]
MYNPISVPGGISCEKVALIIVVFLALFVLKTLLEKYLEKRRLKKKS